MLFRSIEENEKDELFVFMFKNYIHAIYKSCYKKSSNQRIKEEWIHMEKLKIGTKVKVVFKATEGAPLPFFTAV